MTTPVLGSVTRDPEKTTPSIHHFKRTCPTVHDPQSALSNRSRLKQLVTIEYLSARLSDGRKKTRISSSSCTDVGVSSTGRDTWDHNISTRIPPFDTDFYQTTFDSNP
jgi:hypothetical protein